MVRSTCLLVLCFLTSGLWAMDQAVAVARLRYYAGDGAEFVIRSPEGLRGVLDWLAEVEKGPPSEHAPTGGCDRDAELELYAAANDPRPARVVELFTSCKHVLKKEVTAAQFAALRKLAEEKGKRLLVITERDDGRVFDATVGQSIEVRLEGRQPRTGWWASAPNGHAVRCDGAGPGDVAASPTLIFTPKAGATDKALGTYVFRYKAVKPGQAELRVVYVMPGGLVPTIRRATALVKEFVVTVLVTAPPEKAGAP